jgi:hypothetical protein
MIAILIAACGVSLNPQHSINQTNLGYDSLESFTFSNPFLPSLSDDKLAQIKQSDIFTAFRIIPKISL